MNGSESAPESRATFSCRRWPSLDRQAFARHVHCERGVLRVREDLYDLHSYSRVLVVSLGKAGHTMAKRWRRKSEHRSKESSPVRFEPSAQVHGFRYFHGGHPTPNGESIQAASAILRALDAQPASALVIFLLSGGGSSIVEKPIDDEISLDDLIATYRALVHSGAPIAEINAVRKHLSAVKGGRLAQAASPAQQVSLLVSDVPDNTPDALASGPTMPDSTSVEDCYRIAEKYDLLKQFPQSTRELFERHASGRDAEVGRSRVSSVLAGGPYFRTRPRSKRPAARPSARVSSSTSTTPATTGITSARRTICWSGCVN